MIKTVAVVTGTRAEYGLLKPVIKAIRNHNNLIVKVIVTGLHLIPEFGYTINEIIADGINIDYTVDMLLGGDTGGAMAKSLGIGIIGMTNVLEILQPDMLVVLGDRGEAFAATVAAIHLNIPVAHIHGGDIAGYTLDESIRHSITKFAHIHFAATKASAQRMMKMGEEKWRVHVVGSPAIDSIKKCVFKSKTILEEMYEINLNLSTCILLQNPSSFDVVTEIKIMNEIFDALISTHQQSIVIFPNSDAGGKQLIKLIQEYAFYDFIKTYRNIPHDDYLSLLNNVTFMIGNSSSSIIEAPYFNLPAIQIGGRQRGRESSNNLFYTAPNRGEIIKKIKYLNSSKFKNTERNYIKKYGDGMAADKIAIILSQIEINDKLLNKRITL